MVFSSNVFLFLFLPIVFTLYLVIPGIALKNLFLLIASLFFYAWGEVFFVWVMLASIGLNYVFGLLVERNRGTRYARRVLFATCAVNLGMLAFYKYYDFFVVNVNVALEALSLPAIRESNVPLPVGISFFTFHALSYVIDVHRNDAPAQRNPFRIALYISLFSQLVAGPILRYADIAPQLERRRLEPGEMTYGIQRFIVGLGKKVLIANTVASVADQIFALPDTGYTASIAWLGVVCYTLQIYFDFSGYSDMAIGLGHMFGFHFRENFEWPYASKSIKEFWRRWHISLSTWFRDYLYIPLGGNQRSGFRTHVNLLIVFFLCGLWHGANWTFVVWGLFHGLLLIIERTRFAKLLGRMPAPIRHAYVILMVMIGWVFFRAETFEKAIAILVAMAGFGHGDGSQYFFGMYWSNSLFAALTIGIIGSAPVVSRIAQLLETWNAQRDRRGRRAAARTVFACAPAILSLIFVLSAMSLAAGTHNPFIYFRF
jgi:alginate O-acetyltransferase complex protein AlgI